MRANINLVHGDCMEAMKGMKDNQFDLAIVDPPYGIGKFSRISNSGSYKKNYEGNVVTYEYGSDAKWNSKPPSKEYFSELKRISKKSIIWGANYYNCFNPLGGAVVWYKSAGLVSQQSQCEIASISWKKQVDYIALKKLNGFLSPIKYIHPCEKPIALYKWLLENYAKPGDKIIDTHFGSGSIAIACWDLKYDLEAYEIDADYYKAAKKRFDSHIKQGLLF